MSRARSNPLSATKYGPIPPTKENKYFLPKEKSLVLLQVESSVLLTPTNSLLRFRISWDPGTQPQYLFVPGVQPMVSSWAPGSALPAH